MLQNEKARSYLRSKFNIVSQTKFSKYIEITNKENAGIPTTTQNVNVTISVIACSLSRRQVWPESTLLIANLIVITLSKLRIIIIK